MMRYVVILFVLSYTPLIGQQDPLYSQFSFNMELFNPSWSTQYEQKRISILNRNQWAGLPGAPTTQLVSFVSPSRSNKQAWAAYLQRNTLGIQEKLEVSAFYAQQIPLTGHDLRVAATISSQRYALDFTSPDILALNGIDPDPNLEFSRLSNTKLNLGLSMLYKKNNIYAGLYVKNILSNELLKTDLGLSNESLRHVYLTIGAEMDLNANWTYTPQVLYKKAENAPYNLDVLNMFRHKNNLHLGLNIRSGGSQNAMLSSFNYIMGFQIDKNIFAGIAFDLTVSELGDAENGSMELLLRYNIAHKVKEEIIQPDSLSIPFVQTKDSSSISDSSENIQHTDTMDSIQSYTLDQEKLLKGETLVFDSIYYAFDSDIIEPSAAKELDALAEFMIKNRAVQVQLLSFTDSRGTDEYNLDLSNRRANATRDYLVSKGVLESQVSAQGMGEQSIRNKCTNGVECTEEEHNFNRRTEVRIVK